MADLRRPSPHIPCSAAQREWGIATIKLLSDSVPAGAFKAVTLGNGPARMLIGLYHGPGPLGRVTVRSGGTAMDARIMTLAGTPGWAAFYTERLPAATSPAGIPERSLLLEALARLPHRQRAAVTLCYFADMTHAQAAAVLGTRASTVRSQVTRALARLRQDDVLAVLTDTAAAFDGGVTQREHGRRPAPAAAPGKKGTVR